MNTLEIIFFILLSIVFYTYIGYGIILWILVLPLIHISEPTRP